MTYVTYFCLTWSLYQQNGWNVMGYIFSSLMLAPLVWNNKRIIEDGQECFRRGVTRLCLSYRVQILYCIISSYTMELYVVVRMLLTLMVHQITFFLLIRWMYHDIKTIICLITNTTFYKWLEQSWIVETASPCWDGEWYDSS